MNSANPPMTDRQLLARRRQAISRAMRRRLGFWRGLGRSNRLFPRKLEVTREGKWIIGIALLLGIGAVNTGNNLLYLVLSLLISIITISGILSELTLRDVVLKRLYPTTLVAGEPSLLRVEVVNAKGRAAFNIQVAEVAHSAELQLRPGHVLHLAASETGQCFQTVQPQRRGLLATSGLAISTTYPFGFARKSRIFERSAHFVVLPTVAEVDLGPRGSGGRGEREHSRRVGHGSEFRGLREARQGDALRDIHWKVSARRDRLIAREWEDEVTRVVIVHFAHLDPGESGEAEGIDGACATVAGVCATLLDEGVAVGLRSLVGAVAPQVDSDGSGGQLARIRQHLATLLPADRLPPAEWPLDDDDWIACHRKAESRIQQIEQGSALAMAPVRGAGSWETWLVRFEARQEVALAMPPPALELRLDVEGAIATIERPLDPSLEGAA